jgi:hypothetical protein
LQHKILPATNPRGPKRSGGERTRTADFYVANVALYQLSYTPEGTVSVPIDLAAAGVMTSGRKVPWEGAF